MNWAFSFILAHLGAETFMFFYQFCLTTESAEPTAALSYDLGVKVTVFINTCVASCLESSCVKAVYFYDCFLGNSV